MPFASVAFSIAFASTWGICRREMVEVLFLGCVLYVLSVGANCQGWVTPGVGREIAGCHECVLCVVMYWCGASVV